MARRSPGGGTEPDGTNCSRAQESVRPAVLEEEAVAALRSEHEEHAGAPQAVEELATAEQDISRLEGQRPAILADLDSIPEEDRRPMEQADADVAAVTDALGDVARQLADVRSQRKQVIEAAEQDETITAKLLDAQA